MKENNVIDLTSYRARKEQEEFEAITEEIDKIMDEVGLENLSSRFNPVYEIHDPLTGTSGPPTTVSMDLDGCVSTLMLVSYVLTGLGQTEASNDIDGVVVRLMITPKEDK